MISLFAQRLFVNHYFLHLAWYIMGHPFLVIPYNKAFIDIL